MDNTSDEQQMQAKCKVREGWYYLNKDKTSD